MISSKKRVKLGGCLYEIRRHANTVSTRTDTVLGLESLVNLCYCVYKYLIEPRVQSNPNTYLTCSLPNKRIVMSLQADLHWMRSTTLLYHLPSTYMKYSNPSTSLLRPATVPSIISHLLPHRNRPPRPCHREYDLPHQRPRPFVHQSKVEQPLREPAFACLSDRD